MGADGSKEALERDNRNLSSEIRRKDEEVKVIRHDISHLNDTIREGRSRLEREEEESRRMRRRIDKLDHTNRGLENETIRQKHELRLRDVQIELAKEELKNSERRMKKKEHDLRCLREDIEILAEEKREVEIIAARTQRQCEMLVWQNERDRESYEERLAIMDRQAERSSNAIRLLCGTINTFVNNQPTNCLPSTGTTLAITNGTSVSPRRQQSRRNLVRKVSLTFCPLGKTSSAIRKFPLLAKEKEGSYLDSIFYLHEDLRSSIIPGYNQDFLSALKSGGYEVFLLDPEYYNFVKMTTPRTLKKFIRDTPENSSHLRFYVVHGMEGMKRIHHEMNGFDCAWFFVIIFSFFLIFS